VNSANKRRAGHKKKVERDSMALFGEFSMA